MVWRLDEQAKRSTERIKIVAACQCIGGRAHQSGMIDSTEATSPRDDRCGVVYLAARIGLSIDDNER